MHTSLLHAVQPTSKSVVVAAVMICRNAAGGASHPDLPLSDGSNGDHPSSYCGGGSRVAQLLHPVASHCTVP